MDITSEVVALRAAVQAGAPLPDRAEIILRPDGAIDHVRVRLPEPAALEDLAPAFGPARMLPRSPAGGRRAVFPQTGPHPGERTTTVLAEVNRAGRVTVVVLRPDDLRGDPE